jgi:hypothetical protein
VLLSEFSLGLWVKLPTLRSEMEALRSKVDALQSEVEISMEQNLFLRLKLQDHHLRKTNQARTDSAELARAKSALVREKSAYILTKSTPIARQSNDHEPTSLSPVAAGAPPGGVETRAHRPPD